MIPRLSAKVVGGCWIVPSPTFWGRAGCASRSEERAMEDSFHRHLEALNAVYERVAVAKTRGSFERVEGSFKGVG